MATLGLLASTLAAQVALSDTAQARCRNGNEVVSTMKVNGQTVVVEDPRNGTCDGNNRYRAKFRSNDPRYRASVWIQNNGVWKPVKYGGYDTSWVGYEYKDNNSYSFIHFCLNSSPRNYYCGWGDNVLHRKRATHSYYGINSGF